MANEAPSRRTHCVHCLPQTGGEDDLVSIWSFENKGLVARGEGHSSWVVAVAFDPWTCDEKNRVYRIGSVGLDLRLLMWDFSIQGLRIPRKKGERLQRPTSTLNPAVSIDGAIPVAPLPRRMAPTFEPICSRVVDVYPLTDILFRRTCLVTTSQAGSVKLWTRPSFIHGDKDNCDVLSNGKNREDMGKATPDDVIGTLITGFDTPVDAIINSDDSTRLHSPDDSDSLTGCDGDRGREQTPVARTSQGREGYESQRSMRTTPQIRHPNQTPSPPEKHPTPPQAQPRPPVKEPPSDTAHTATGSRDKRQADTQIYKGGGQVEVRTQPQPQPQPQPQHEGTLSPQPNHRAFASDDEDGASLDADTHTHTDLTVPHSPGEKQTHPSQARVQSTTQHSQSQGQATTQPGQTQVRSQTPPGPSQGQDQSHTSPPQVQNQRQSSQQQAQPVPKDRGLTPSPTESASARDAQSPRASPRNSTHTPPGAAEGDERTDGPEDDDGDEATPLPALDTHTKLNNNTTDKIDNTLARTATIEVLGRGPDISKRRHADSINREEADAIAEDGEGNSSSDSGCEEHTNTDAALESEESTGVGGQVLSK